MNKTLLALLGTLVLFPAATLADEPSLGPVIDGYGPTYPIDERDVKLPDDFVYRVVFDATAYPDVKDLNTTLISVARFLNMHGRNGVALENMDIAVVIHGPALQTMLADDAYQARSGIGNPNSELIARLDDAGVRFFVCGQSMAFGGFAKSDLLPSAKVALSAMTMLTVLQSEGFALLP